MCSCPLAHPSGLLALSAYAERMKVFSITSSNSLPARRDFVLECSACLGHDFKFGFGWSCKRLQTCLKRLKTRPKQTANLQSTLGSVDVGWAERADVTSAWNEHDEGDSKAKDEANRSKNEERESRVQSVSVCDCDCACVSVRACAACERATIVRVCVCNGKRDNPRSTQSKWANGH